MSAINLSVSLLDNVDLSDPDTKPFVYYAVVMEGVTIVMMIAFSIVVCLMLTTRRSTDTTSWLRERVHDKVWRNHDFFTNSDIWIRESDVFARAQVTVIHETTHAQVDVIIEQTVPQDMEENEECTICHESEPTAPSGWHVLECDHRFHMECLTQWFHANERRTCPVCRQSYRAPMRDT
jgi:hypothetical protein